jgi:hypothetical protein
MNYFGFGANFISSWIRIRIWNADPDPGDKFNADPDPKHWHQPMELKKKMLNFAFASIKESRKVACSKE